MLKIQVFWDVTPCLLVNSHSMLSSLCGKSLSLWLGLFSSQTFSPLNTATFSNLVIFHTYPPLKMEQTECSETSAHKTQTPGSNPEESTQHSEYGESLKSRMVNSCLILRRSTASLSSSSNSHARKDAYIT